MKRNISIAISTALIFSALALKSAAAAEISRSSDSEYSARKTEKINSYLDSIGINNPAIITLANNVTARMEKGHLRFVDEPLAGGRVMLHYQMQSGIKADNLQLKFRIDGANGEFVATPKAVMYNYQMRF